LNDDQPSHHARGIAHEARAIGKCRVRSARHVQIRLVKQRRHAEADGGARPRQLATRHAMELGIERFEETLARLQIAALDGADERRDDGDVGDVRGWVRHDGSFRLPRLQERRPSPERRTRFRER
jgi:hypothetical protein